MPTWNPASKRGSIRQAFSPYAADSVLRIVHTLLLSREQGFLLHASSAVRNGRAFLFTGPSGAERRPSSATRPHDVVVLTDEISYVRRRGDQYLAFGTPFAGEWADVGEPISARSSGCSSWLADRRRRGFPSTDRPRCER